MAAIRFEGVGKRYADGHSAIRALDLEIADGEFLVLVGPSGCGKSTALRMIAGLEDITEGRLLIDGMVANGLAPRDRDVAMVFQSYALYPHMTVAENIGFGLSARGVPKAKIAAKVRETAKLLELEEHLARKPGQLSGGQRQRVAMGRAIARKPKAFLMDEPLSNLDARLRGHMRAEIARLQELTGVTTVYVTHDQIEAMTMGDRVAALRGGLLQQVGPPRALYDTPANLFVAGFIGAPTMNFLRVEIVDEGGLVAVAGQFRLALPPERVAASPRLAAYAGRAVMMGVRPEALTVAASESEASLIGRIAFVEDFGANRLVHLDVDLAGTLSEIAAEPDEVTLSAPRLRALIDAGVAVRAGERLALAIDARRAHLFDVESEHAIRD
jgi:multiple sugar transport system ATP-binding protein